MNKKTGIYVPARLSSQRLPNKQILPLGNSCMFDICCQKLDKIKQEYGINTYALVYEKELLDIAKKYSNVITIQRDEKTAKAEGPLVYIFKDVLDVEDTHLMFLNPCLSFLSVDTIVNNVKKFNESNADYATSVKNFQNWLLQKDGQMITDINYQRLTTKEIEPLYQTAHCFHIFNKEQFKQDGYMLKDGFLPLEVPQEETIDIDTPDEYEYAFWKWEKKKNEICG